MSEEKKKTRVGGRAKGTPNKDKQELLALIRKAVGDDEYHPVVEMARLSVSTDKEITSELKFQATKEVAQYIAPKHKAVEHTLGDEDTRIAFMMAFGGDEAN